MSHFAIVRTDAEQPWHAIKVSNARITFRTENYARQVGAERALLADARTFGYQQPELVWNVPGREKVLFDAADPSKPVIAVLMFDGRAKR